MDKLMDEVKLYWTIQIGIVGVLGLLLSKIDPEKQVATAVVAGISFLLVMIGAVTNAAGNYYTFETRERLGTAQVQEGIISSMVEVIYLFLTATCGAVLFWAINPLLFASVLKPPSFVAALVGFLLGALANVVATRVVFNRLRQAGSAQYRDYITKSWIFGRLFLGRD